MIYQSQANQNMTIPKHDKKFPMVWAIVAILAIALPIIIYQIFPSFGIETFSNLFTINTVGALIILPLLGLGYWHLLDHVCEKPQHLLFGFWLMYPLLAFFSFMMIYMGINTMQTAWVLLLFIVPSFFIGLRYLIPIWQQLPYLRHFVFFVMAIAGYYFFFQEPIFDQRSNAGQFTLGFYFLFTLVVFLGQIITTASAYLSSTNPQKTGEQFSKLVILFTLAIAVVGVIGYQSELLTINDHFTKRARSVFSHPAHFAHYISLCMTYLVSWILYKKQQGTLGKKELTLLGSTLAIGFIALMLSFAKTAIFTYVLALLIIFSLNITSWSQAKKYLTYIAAVIIIGGGSLLGYDKISDSGIVDSLIQRISEGSSMEWRDRVVRYLGSEITPDTVLLGHGMSAAKIQMSMFEGYIRDQGEPPAIIKVVHVHNGYLSQMYDYGLVGISVFIVLGYIAIRKLFTVIATPISRAFRLIDIGTIGLIFYFMLSCWTDTLFEIPTSPFWILLTIMILTSETLKKAKGAQQWD